MSHPTSTFGRCNPHCSGCGDERGGPFGHEISECLYRPGMSVGELAASMPPDKRTRYYDAQIERWFGQQEQSGEANTG